MSPLERTVVQSQPAPDSSLLSPQLCGCQYSRLCFTDELHFACELQSLRPLHKHFPLSVSHFAYLLANSYSSKMMCQFSWRSCSDYLSLIWVWWLFLRVLPTFCTKTHKSHDMVCVSRLVVSNSLQPHGLDCSPWGSSVLGILQARTPEWVAMPFFRESSCPGIEPTSHVSFIGRWALYH